MKWLLTAVLLWLFTGISFAANPIISSVATDCDTGDLVVFGDFTGLGAATVTLDTGVLHTLNVTSQTDSAITTDLPDTCDVLAGTHRLRVGTNQGHNTDNIIDVTIGTVGPEGPQGIQGPQGTPGLIGSDWEFIERGTEDTTGLPFPLGTFNLGPTGPGVVRTHAYLVSREVCLPGWRYLGGVSVGSVAKFQIVSQTFGGLEQVNRTHYSHVVVFRNITADETHNALVTIGGKCVQWAPPLP